jgi:hypothetical protein
LTDEQLAELEAQQGQPEITAGLVDRLAAAPAPTEGFTDRQLDSLPVLASTPFAAERGITLPPEAPAEPEPMTDYELNQLEEENYRRVDYIMPEEEFRQYWTRRKEENNEVGRFIDGVGQGAAGMLAMIPEAGREIRDGMVGMVTDPVNQVQRNVQTGAEVIRKAGINMVQLFDWVGNKVNDVGAWAQRRGLKRQALAKQLEQQGRLTGDELRDAEIIAAAAGEADAMEPTPLEEEEDFGKAYERYQREKALEQEFAGVTNFQIGASKVGSPATSKDAYQITDEQPAETLSMLGSMAVDPVNLLPVGAGALSKLRVLRRTATLAGAPLRGVQRAADATADLAERAEFGISSRVQDITGLTAKQQAALGAGAAGAAVYADQAGGGGNFTTAVTAIGSVLPGLRYGGAIIRKTGAAAGGAATIIREAGVGGIGTARAEAAADLARMTAIPERYRKYFTSYVDGTDSTLKRVAQDAGNPEALRRVARFADRAGVTTAARLADDVTSGAVAAGITGAPFAALQPDAERAGEVFGGIMALGGAGGLVGSAIGRRSAAPDADVARMMADVYAVGGNVDALSALPHATLDRMAAMQGVLSSKVDFVPLKADEYRMNKDVSATGGELAAGLFLEKDANGRARVFINLDARRSAGGVDAIAPHEIGHAILTSNILDGQPRNDLRNLVNQQYGPDGVQARGREYVTRLVDGDIQNGTTGELPQVLTEQEFRDLESGNKSVADIAKGRKLEPSERERLINERYEELSQRSIERGEDALDWARDEIVAETFASEAPAIDFRAIRRDAAFPRLAESMLAAGGRVLEMMGVNLDRSTGRMLDNPSVLFRENPLFQDRIMQRRVKEYVRAYDQYLTGLEEAGSATPRGVELARSSRPEDMARSTHVKLRDEGRGVLENDFLFQKPDGTYAYKPQKIITAAEANRAAQIKTLYDAKKFVPVNSTEFGKRKVNGREVIGGPVLPPQFDLFTQFPKHVREFARSMEASRAEGGSWDIDYNAIGTGSSGRYRITNMGNVRAIQRETVPLGWQVTKANHLLAVAIDLNAFRAATMKAINRGELGIFNNDMKQVEADLKIRLANHREGRPGEATIGQAKRDILNGLIGTGTAVQRAANPLYAELNPKGSLRTWRVDRLNDAKSTGRTGYFFDYDKENSNRMPQQIPREAQGMPDAPVSGRGDGMPDAPRRYVPMEQFIKEAGDDLGEVLANAYADMDINEDRNALVGFVDTRNSMYRQRIPVKEFFDWLHSDEPMRGLVFDSENKPATAGEGASYTREGYEALLNRLRDISLRKPKPSAAPRGQAMPDAGPQDGTVVKGRAMPDAQSIFGKPTESDSGGSTWRLGRGDQQLDVSYSKGRNSFYVNAADGEYGPYASAAEAADALLEVGRDVADKARPAIERDALRDGLTASKKVAGEGGIRSVGVSRVKGSTKSDSLYFDVSVELDPKLGKRLYDQGVQDRRDTSSWGWDIDEDAGVIEGAIISVRISDHADVSAFSKSTASIQDFVTPTRRGDWLQSADRVMQDIEDRLGAPLPRLKIQKPAIADGPLEAVASRLAAVRSKQQPSTSAANVNRQPSAAPRAQAMPDSLESAPTDQLLRQYEENQGYLGLSTLGMREGRPVRGGAAQTRELLRRNEAISAELERRGVRSEDAQLQRALQRRGQAMPDAAGAFDEDAGAYLIAAGDNESLPVYQQADKRGKPAVDGTGKAKFVPIDYDLLHGPGITKYTGPGPEDTTKPNYKGLAYDITQKGQREIDAAIDSGAVDNAANRVVDFTVEAMKNPEIAAGKGWYSRMRDKLLAAMGEKGRELFAQLLGATSAKTPVEANFLQAFDAFEGINAGRYDRHRKAYLDMLEAEDGNNLTALIVERGYTTKVRAMADSLSKESRKLKGKKKAEVLFRAGKLRDLAKKPASQWTRKDRFDITILAEDILPLRSNGKKFNSNSHAVLKVIAGTWLDNRKSPKTPNFAGNLTGRTLQATIDVWAARHLRELLYAGGNEPWRIQPRSEIGVNPQDFALGQIIMQRAAKKLDMNPDDLQAILWFAEKNKWDANGWTGAEGANKSSFDETFDRAFPSGQKPLTFQEVSKILSEED